MAETEYREPDSYDLQIDAQTEKFIEVRQKLSYFLITAGTVVIGFLAQYVINNRDDVGDWFWLAIASSIGGLFAAGSALFNLYFELRSYRLHIKSRYERKSYDSVRKSEREDWDQANKMARLCMNSAFAFLFIQIVLAVAFFSGVFAGEGV